MFKDTNEGSTHYYNDGCGEPAHNDTKKTSYCLRCNKELNNCKCPQRQSDGSWKEQPKESWESEYKQIFGCENYPHPEIRDFIRTLLQEQEQKIKNEEQLYYSQKLKEQKKFLQEQREEAYEKGKNETFTWQAINKLHDDIEKQAIQEYKKEIKEWIEKNKKFSYEYKPFSNMPKPESKGAVLIDELLKFLNRS